jgi:acetyl-CoA decarbonylase/synthase complex subunit delta
MDITPETISELNNSDFSDCDIYALRCKIKDISEIEKVSSLLKEILQRTDKQIMICGCGKDDIDAVLLPKISKIPDRECIISFATEQTYKNIIPSIIENNHYIVLKTPIDINLAKELNILSIEMGLKKEKIIMNTDIGGLGYGYEYGYSIMEKIRLEAEKGDEYLNLPLISEASSESMKTKEAKTLGNKYARMIEITAVTGVLAAGANIVTVTYPENLKIIRGLI